MTYEFETQAAGRRKADKPLTGVFAVGAAQAVLFWERLWPAVPPALAPAFLIVIASLFGLWSAAPSWAHLAALGGGAFLTLAALLRFTRAIAWPSRREALARLEEDGGLHHAPLQTLEDRPFGTSATSPLWQAHIEEMRKEAARARLSRPSKTADAYDPWSLRFAAPGLLLIALVAAGPDRAARLAQAFDPGASGETRAIAADLWIEPPAYTGKAPVFLLRAGASLAGQREQIDVPQGSLIVAQINARRFLLSLKTPDETVKAQADPETPGHASLTIAASGLLRLKIAGAEGRWPIGVIADDPPTVQFIEDPSTTDDARLAIAIAIDDDYGVVSGALHLRLDPDQERPLDAPALDEASIRERRVVALDGIAGKSGERRFDLDLQSDPWAGLTVIGGIVATDGAGQTSETPALKFRLPAKPFYNPLARAVVEQRQTLAVAPSDWRRAGRSFDALTLAPEHFYEKSTDYLLMRTAFWRVMRRNDDGFAGAVKEFWPLALQLEDEALELAKRRLDAAKEALRMALENGAPADEISKLVENLREAMQNYLQALAQSGERMAESGGGQSQTIQQGDLDGLLDSIRDLSQSGADRAARQALDDLENILNNLRLSSGGSGQGGQGQASGGQSGQGGGPAGEAGDLIGRQRELSNQSFKRGQTQGSTGDDLAGEEKGLAGDLKKLLDQLGQRGASADPDGKGAEALGEALSSMREAENALKADNFDAATTAMEQAIANLRDGAQALAEAQGKQARGEAAGDGSEGAGVDPLGRPTGNAYGRGVDVPEDSDVQRARDVLEELRRRLSDGKRSEDEIDYLERLLERF